MKCTEVKKLVSKYCTDSFWISWKKIKTIEFIYALARDHNPATQNLCPHLEVQTLHNIQVKCYTEIYKPSLIVKTWITFCLDYRFKIQ